MTTTVKIQVSVNKGRLIEVYTEDPSLGWSQTDILNDGDYLEVTVFDWQRVRVMEIDDEDGEDDEA